VAQKRISIGRLVSEFVKMSQAEARNHPKGKDRVTMTDKARSTRGYFDRMAKQWDDLGDAGVLRKRLEPLVGMFNLPKSGIVLDVGTGTGILHPLLLAAVGRSGTVLAFDFSREMIEQARTKESSQNLLCFQADVTAVPLPEHTCDCIVCFAAFPHFHDKLRALQEMARVTKTGGRVLIAHLMSRHQIARHHHGSPEVAGHCLPPDEEMEQLFTEAGLEIVTIRDKPGCYFAQGVRQI
jgi:ubiquinone/menaquinone biosynthesis C-methylase UbiE